MFCDYSPLPARSQNYKTYINVIGMIVSDHKWQEWYKVVGWASTRCVVIVASQVNRQDVGW